MKKKSFSLLIVMGLMAGGIYCHAVPKAIKIWDKHGKGRNSAVITAYPSDADTAATAVIVCPGGSYFWLDKKNEGHDVAKWLNSKGLAAFVLEYRVAGKINFPCPLRFLYDGNRFPRMLEDIQRAISLVRSAAEEYGVNPSRVGVMGFSAGGHLAMLSAEFNSDEYLLSEGYSVNVPLRPDFVVPIYPVVTMSDKRYVHKRSRRGLLGDTQMYNEALRDSLSLEKHIPDDCCPVFLVNSIDDKVVDYHNSVILDQALSEKGIPHEYYQFPSGGHGFGIKEIEYEGEIFDWKPLFLKWLSKIR